MVILVIICFSQFISSDLIADSTMQNFDTSLENNENTPMKLRTLMSNDKIEKLKNLVDDLLRIV